MSDVSTFDRLPNELIVCIFGYLNPADNFRSFFDCNDRLRKLVKRYVTYSRQALDRDITRFSTLHSWYKHLDFVDDSVTFYLIPRKGEQERYSFDPCVSDSLGIHWRFWQQGPVQVADKRIQRIIHRYPFKLNPCFHPQGPRHGPSSPGFRDLVRRYYPLQFDALTTTLFSRSDTSVSDASTFLSDDIKIQLRYIYENEPKRLKNIIQEAAEHIWKELQELEDVNILEIIYSNEV